MTKAELVEKAANCSCAELIHGRRNQSTEEKERQGYAGWLWHIPESPP
jgi:hypothetical protein